MSERINSFLTRKVHKLSRPVKCDPQRHLVYRMERDIAGWAIYVHMERDDLQRIADYICRRYKVKRASVVIEHKGKERVFGWLAGESIHLNADYHGANTAVLAHELAHYVADIVRPSDVAHGPEFITTYAEILDMLNLFPQDLFYKLCDLHGVEYE